MSPTALSYRRPNLAIQAIAYYSTVLLIAPSRNRPIDKNMSITSTVHCEPTFKVSRSSQLTKCKGGNLNQRTVAYRHPVSHLSKMYGYIRLYLFLCVYAYRHA